MLSCTRTRPTPTLDPEIVSARVVARHDYVQLVRNAFANLGTGQDESYELTTSLPPRIRQVEPSGNTGTYSSSHVDTTASSLESETSAGSGNSPTVFISYASEDATFVRSLAYALQEREVQVWFDEFELTVGDSIRRAIDKGLGMADHGVVVLSPRFFAKEWPQKELDALVQKGRDGRKVILPVWFDVTLTDVEKYSMTLASLVAAKADEGLEDVVTALLKALK